MGLRHRCIGYSEHPWFMHDTETVHCQRYPTVYSLQN